MLALLGVLNAYRGVNQHDKLRPFRCYSRISRSIPK